MAIKRQIKIKLLLLPAIPIVGAFARHYSPEWLDDAWVFSGLLSFLAIAILIVSDLPSGE